MVQLCPQEYSQVEEIYRLRRMIVERLRGHADLLRWCLGEGD